MNKARERRHSGNWAGHDLSIMNTLIVVRDMNGAVPYWAADETLAAVRARYKRLAGKFPSTKASIVSFTGKQEDLDKVAVNDLGDIIYSKNLAKAVIQ